MSSETENLPAQQSELKNGRLACIAISVAVIVLNWEPTNIGKLILRPLTYLYTFVHEMGHGVAAWLTGGSFTKFEMWLDGSGMATSLIEPTAFNKAFTAFGGLVAPAIWAAICLILGRSAKWSRYGFYAFTGLMVPAMVLVILGLSPFGIVFVALCAIACFCISKFAVVKDSSGKIVEERKYPQYLMLFIAITLCTNVFTRGDYLFTAVAQTGAGEGPSDVGHIANALLLPYWIWGGLIALISIAVLAGGIWLFFKPTAAEKQQAIKGE